MDAVLSEDGVSTALPPSVEGLDDVSEELDGGASVGTGGGAWVGSGVGSAVGSGVACSTGGSVGAGVITGASVGAGVVTTSWLADSDWD